MRALAREARATAALALLMSSETGGGGITPSPAWSTPAWFIDPVAGNDSNAGTSSAHPLKTWLELIRRYGTYSPTFRTTVTITFLSSQADNSDPVILSPVLANGASLILQGLLNASTQVATGVLAGVVARNQATGQLLEADLGASATKGLFLVNATHPGRAFVYTNVAGNVWKLGQSVLAVGALPLASNNLTEVNTFANGDAFTLFRLTGINVVLLFPTYADTDPVSFGNMVYLRNLQINDPAGIAFDPFTTNNYVQLIECLCERTMEEEITAGNVEIPSACLNSYLIGGYFGGGNGSLVGNGTGTQFSLRQFYACILGDAAESFQLNFAGAVFDFDTIIAGCAFNDVGFMNGVLSTAFLDTGVTLQMSGTPIVGANVLGPVVWGAGTINGMGSTRIKYPSGVGAAVATFKNAGGITLNSATTATSHTGAAPDVLNSGITITPAHLDAAAGAAGFGGDAFVLGGASISNGGP